MKSYIKTELRITNLSAIVQHPDSGRFYFLAKSGARIDGSRVIGSDSHYIDSSMEEETCEIHELMERQIAEHGYAIYVKDVLVATGTA